MKEKRTEPRVKTNVPMVAWWEDETGGRRFSRGKLEDISNSGLRFRSREEIPVGTRLFVRTPMGEYVGHIVRSSADGEEFDLGIKKSSEQQTSVKYVEF